MSEGEPGTIDERGSNPESGTIDVRGLNLEPRTIDDKILTNCAQFLTIKSGQK